MRGCSCTVVKLRQKRLGLTLEAFSPVSESKPQAEARENISEAVDGVDSTIDRVLRYALPIWQERCWERWNRNWGRWRKRVFGHVLRGCWSGRNWRYGVQYGVHIA